MVAHKQLNLLFDIFFFFSSVLEHNQSYNLIAKQFKKKHKNLGDKKLVTTAFHRGVPLPYG